jgi:RNA polymerase subunit RPABC4/transcription elongation factor Spt4
MKIYCQQCERGLRVWETRCPYCHQSVMSWLHIVIITAFAVTTIFYLFKFL